MFTSRGLERSVPHTQSLIHLTHNSKYDVPFEASSVAVGYWPTYRARERNFPPNWVMLLKQILGSVLKINIQMIVNQIENTFGSSRAVQHVLLPYPSGWH